jgi:hypothetical protein
VVNGTGDSARPLFNVAGPVLSLSAALFLTRSLASSTGKEIASADGKAGA